MAHLDWLTHADFVGRMSDRFDLALGQGSALALELVETEEGSEPGGLGPDGQERLQFSLFFRGPTAPLLPQATYRLSHPDLGELDLFLVPIGADTDGVRYEAAFA